MIHQIIAVKDALIRRNIEVDPECLVCGQGVETIEHLFFQCEFARRVWRASHLGFDFEIGNPVDFGSWFTNWLKEAPDKDAIQDSIILLWTIWYMRNDALFKRDTGNVDDALHRFSGIAKHLQVLQAKIAAIIAEWCISRSR